MSNSDVESLSFSDREDCSTDQIELPAPTNHNTAGRALRDGVKYRKAEDELGGTILKPDRLRTCPVVH